MLDAAGGTRMRSSVRGEDAHVDYDFDGTERFEVTARLGEGAMGVVYQAVDRERNETVALKALRALDGEGLLRFKNEFRTIQSLEHPNLVSLGELIETHGRWFFTMELVEGTDFYTHVRSTRRSPGADVGDATTEPDWGPEARRNFDEARLRGALRQLGAGLVALHRAGLVHRDIKPSNILVSRTGRVVLLDFGFVTTAHERSSDRVVGTVAYMSPEQAASLAVGPEADWYAVGVILYEALTGRQPFEGMPLEVLMAKQHRQPRPPSELAPGIPDDLDALCRDLLRTSPAERPREAEILRRLGIDASSSTGSSSNSLSAPHTLFVGREAELAQLDQAYDRCRAGETVAVFVHGESGIGKSALVKTFLGRLGERAPDVLVLASTCYERESVPYKAFDGVADNLSRHLVDLPNVEAAILMPLHLNYVAEVFPVLRRCEVVARTIRPLMSSVDPTEMRARVFAGIREMFARLAARRPLVVVIDDFQWADEDSLALLRELVRPPEAPPLLLVTTVRDTGRPGPVPGSSQTVIGAEHTVEIRLEGLTREDAHEMASKLADNLAPSMAASLDEVVRESRGHPLYIDEIVRFGAVEGAEAAPTLHLDTVLWSRIIGLDPPAREILELITISSAPLEKSVAASTVRQSFAEFSRRVSHLRLGKLVQTTGVRKNDRIDVFHDRVRQAVLAHLTPNQRREYHERLALALEGTGNAAPEALAIHWSGAGDQDKALDYTRIAAEQAERALAFERAARLYRRCLDLLPPRSRQSAALRARLGDALANAGRGPESANAYLAAAEDAGEDTVRLYAKAAGQLLRSGHVDSSLEVLRRALEGLDLELPETPRSALVSLLRQRAVIRLRGLGFRERHESELPERDLTRVDISWALAVGFGLIDVIRGAEFQAKHLRLALRTGEMQRVARALSVEVAYRYTSGTRGSASSGRALALAKELSARLGDPPALVGLNTLMAGIGSICEGRWAAAEERCARAEEILRDQCSGMGWELSSARLMHLWSLWYQGKLREIDARVPAILREARERGDLYAATSCRTYFTPMSLLGADDPDRAADEAKRALSRWSQRGFHFQHYFHLFAMTQVKLYRGDGAGALELVTSSWPALRSSLLLSVQQNKVEALHFRARAELAAGRAAGDRALIAAAVGRARAIEKEQTVWGNGLAQLVRAAAAAEPTRAADHLTRAAALFDETGMRLFAAAARRRLGLVTGGEAGDAATASAEATLRQLGAANPGAFADMLAPGFALPTS